MGNYTIELYHYGVKGMKWGIRRDKKRYQRELNRLDKESTKEIARGMTADVKARKAASKGVRHIQKSEKYGRTPNDNDAKKLAKITDKVKRYTADKNNAFSRSKEIDKKNLETYSRGIRQGLYARQKRNSQECRRRTFVCYCHSRWSYWFGCYDSISSTFLSRSRIRSSPVGC